MINDANAALLAYMLRNYRFDATDGHFYRLRDMSSFKASSRVGVLNALGYWQINIFNRSRLAHRMVWLFNHGPIPHGKDIDHVNGIRHDNRLDNLRLATKSQNQQNAAPQRTSASQTKGVYFNKSEGKWLARIRLGKTRRSLGLHDTREAAAEAYRKASIELFGAFAYAARPVDNIGESGD